MQVAAIIHAMPETGDDVPTESLACKAALQRQQGSAPGAALATRYIADKGFATYADEWVPGVIDTAWGFMATENPSAIQRKGTLEWLASKQAAGFFKVGGHSNIYATAIVLRALNADALKSATTLALARPAAQALLGKQKVAGNWADSPMLTALAFEAVHPYTAALPQLGPAVEAFLLAQQKPNGSWNDDPYTTALALRALALVGVKPADPEQQANSAIVKGTVYDEATNSPLAGASIAALSSPGGTPVVAQSDANGHYTLQISPAGQLVISVTKDGYSLVTAHAYVPPQETLLFSPSLAAVIGSAPGGGATPTTAALSGSVTQASDGQPLAAVLITARDSSTGTTYSATTDALGAFSITGIPPGTLVVSAEKTGWQTISASATLQANTTGLFSPALQLSSAAGASPVPIEGKVIDAQSKSPLESVKVRIKSPAGTIDVSTDANGFFSATTSPGEVLVSYSKDGYGPATQSAFVTAGARIDAGVVELAAATLISTLHGRVLDTAGAPIASATVTIGALNATTGAAGAYVLDGLSGTQWSVEVAAAGYATRTFELRISAPGAIAQDFVLPSSAGEAYLDLSNLTASPWSATINQVIQASLRIGNTSALPMTSSVAMEVQASSGAVVATLPVLDATGIPHGDVTLQPGESIDVAFRWNTTTNAAGSYSLIAKLIEPGSRSKDNPTGNVTGSLRTAVVLTETALFAGAVNADPPVVQSGANTPVRFSAILKNTGNVPLPAGAYTLKVSNATSNALAHQAAIQVPAIALDGYQEVDFGTWTPTKAASLKVEVVAGHAPGAAIQTTLYVGDLAKADFTVDKTIVPPGDQTAKGKIRITGLDMASGSSTDSFAPLIRDAVTKAVRYGDDYAYAHHVADLKCFACHVQTQSLVGGERNLRFVQPLDWNKRTELLNATLQAMDQNGVVQSSTGPQTNTMLGLWATKEWHNPQEVASSNRKLAEALMNFASNGRWNTDYTGYWWGSTGQSTGINVTTLVDYARQARKHGAGTVKTVAAQSFADLAPTGEKRLAALDDGTLYVADKTNGTLHAIAPGAASAVKLASMASLQNVRVISSNRLLVATLGGVFLHDLATGTQTLLNAQPSTDALELADGTFLVRPNYQAKVLAVTAQGVASDFINNAAIGTSGGQLEQQADGALLVTNPGLKRILRFERNGTLRDTPAAYTAGTPLQLTRYGNQGYLLSTDTGLYWYNENWVVERLTFGMTHSAVRLPDANVLLSDSGAIRRMAFTPADAAALATRIDNTLAQSATLLASGTIFNASNNMDVAYRMQALAKLREHYQGTARAQEFDTLIDTLAHTLWARQRSDGGWEVQNGWYNRSDPVVTAIVGVALDATNPSRNDKRLRDAIQYILTTQRPDGTWLSTNNLGGALLSSTWIEIWLPTMLDRMGALDADLSVTFAPDVQPSAFSYPPAQTQLLADGSTRYTWSFTGVTQEGRELTFDLALQGMGLQEVRPAAVQAELVFQNSFVAGEVVSPLVVPRIAADAHTTIAAQTDKPVYQDQDTAEFLAPVTNAGVGAIDAQVRLTVLDADGATVAALPLPAPFALPAGATQAASSPWNVAGVFAGEYVLRAELLAPDGAVYGSAEAPFQVVGGSSQGNATRITTSRGEYLRSEAVHVTSRAGNTSSIAVQSDLRAQTTITAVATPGTPSFTRTETIAQLLPANVREYGYTLPAGSLAAGTYQAQLQLLDSAGQLLSESMASFQVRAARSACVPGLQGTLHASPGSAARGATVQLHLALDNPAAQALNAATVTLRLVDPDSGTVLHQDARQDVAIAASGQWSQDYPVALAQDFPARVLAIASVDTGACEDTLATTHISVTQSPAPDPDPGPGPGPGSGPGSGPGPGPGSGPSTGPGGSVTPTAIPVGGPWFAPLLGAALALAATLRAGRRRKRQAHAHPGPGTPAPARGSGPG